MRLYLPPLFDNAEAEAPSRPPVAEAPFTGGRRVLLVEDDVNVSAIALDLLESFGSTSVWPRRAPRRRRRWRPNGSTSC